MLRTFRRLHRIKSRYFFDGKFYRDQYPDVSEARVDAFHHYMRCGWKEGRNPSRSFPSLLYKDKYLGLNSDINPLQHYAGLTRRQRLAVDATLRAESVQIQKRVIQPFFDERFYKKLYKIESSLDAVEHYLTEGWTQGYEPNRFFSSKCTIEQHPHIVEMGLNPFYHFVSTYGLIDHAQPLDVAVDAPGEALNQVSRYVIKRMVEQDFDSVYYLSHYHDVRKAGVDPLEHYIDFGWKEGRNPSDEFWTAHYGEQYLKSMPRGTNPLVHYVSVGRDQGLLPNPFGYRSRPDPVAPSAAEWEAIAPAADLLSAEVVVIIPVYKGYDETLRAIHAVLANRQRTAFALIVVDDHGPDASLRAAIKDLAARGFLILMENQKNLGFVRSVNLGVNACRGKSVILLNSDAIPFGDWIDRLVAHDRANRDAATITPLSNNATICSYPQPNANNRLQLEAPPAELDAYARECNAGMSVEIPTAVGYCVFIRADLFTEIGEFDAETFGLGYGEENDFSMRARKAGYRNLLAYDIFVYHKGSVSFDDAYRNTEARVENLLSLKHPDYLSSVRRYIEADPGRDGRTRLDLFRIAKHVGGRSAVLVSHDRGGGIETHVQTAAAQLAREGVDVVLFRISSRWKIAVTFASLSPRAVLTLSCNDLHIVRHHALIETFLKWLQPLFVHVHSFVGLEWESTRRLMSMIAKTTDKYYYTLHDYSALCHRNHLVTTAGVFCGLASVEVCRSCLSIDYDEDDCVAPDERRRTYAKFLAGAEAIFAPSDDIAQRVAPLLPNLPITVRPHHETLPIRPMPQLRNRRRNAPLRIAIVGAIGPHKGIDTVYSLALDARVRGLPIEYMIIGYSSMPHASTEVGVLETGAYDAPEDALDLIDWYDVDLILIPSIWPESYCYTLSIALASGIPPIVFDMGAPADRLRASGQGLLLDPKLIHTPHLINDQLVGLSLVELYARRSPYRQSGYKTMLADYYGFGVRSQAASRFQVARTK